MSCLLQHLIEGIQLFDIECVLFLSFIFGCGSADLNMMVSSCCRCSHCFIKIFFSPLTCESVSDKWTVKCRYELH